MGLVGAQVIPQMLRNAITGAALAAQLPSSCSCCSCSFKYYIEEDALQQKVFSAMHGAFSSVSGHWQAEVGGHSILHTSGHLGGQSLLEYW